MKIFFALLISAFVVSSPQTESDLTQIVSLVVAEYKSDTVHVYQRFDNSLLISDLQGAKRKKDSKIFEKYGTDFKEIAPKVVDDTVTVSLDGIRVVFKTAEVQLQKRDKERLKSYTDIALQRSKKKPYAYISCPLISTDGNRAIIYSGYFCGKLCGSGGVFHLEKVNGKWSIVEYKRHWVA